MPYVGSDGRLQQSQPFGIGYIKDLIYGFFGFFVLFYRSILHLDDGSTKGQYGNNRGNNDRAFPNAWPRRRMGGFGSRGSAPAPPPCAPGGG